jgi:hypothetical protein
VTTPTQVPAELIAGDTWEWTRELADYPPSTHSAAWYFEKADHNFSVSAGESGSTYTGTVAAGTSAGYRPGKYRWRLLVTRTADSVRKTVEEGWLVVLPDPAAAGNVDHRSTAQVMLDNVEAFLRDPNNLQAANFSLGGRALVRWNRGDLLAERDRLKGEVRSEEAVEKIAAGLGNPRRLYVRFDRG